MKPDVTHYDRDCLRQLLDDSLAEPLASEIALHVAECADCRTELESLAANPDWWSSACSGAKAILDDPAAYQSSGLDWSHSSRASDSSINEESFASDFAVDFLAPSDDPAMLGRLDDYEILEVIGRGGMGIVFKGFQKELHRCVAVKVLAPHLALSAAARRRFEREAQATAAVVHQHVMAIHSVAANARLPYLVMPFVACESLQQRLDRHGPLDLRDILRIGMQAANGLAAAHAQGLVHRDVKPANILLETNVDRVMLTDFGLARAVDDATLTRTGIIAGTPMYMSPEQANGDAVDHRSDLFSLGSVLYAMCTARPPFRSETTFGVLRRIREALPRPIREINADIPDWFERIVMKLLAKQPDDRIASATQTADLLERCLAHVQQPTIVELPTAIQEWAIDASIAGASSERPRHNRSWVMMTILVISVALITTVWAWVGRTPTQQLEKQTSSAPEERAPVDASSVEWNRLQDELNATTSAIEKLEASARDDLSTLQSIRAIPHETSGKEQE